MQKTKSDPDRIDFWSIFQRGKQQLGIKIPSQVAPIEVYVMQEKNKIPRDLIGKFLIFFKILLFLHCMTPNYAGLFLYYSYTFHSAYSKISHWKASVFVSLGGECLFINGPRFGSRTVDLFLVRSMWSGYSFKFLLWIENYYKHFRNSLFQMLVT